MSQGLDVRVCVVCGSTSGEMEPMATPRGPVWICKQRGPCEERGRLAEAQQRAVVTRPAFTKEPDPVDDFLSNLEDEGEFSTFESLCICYVGRRIQITTTDLQPAFKVIQGVLKAVGEDCLVLQSEWGSQFVRFAQIQSLGVIPSDGPTS